jgi:hypothetical protein
LEKSKSLKEIKKNNAVKLTVAFYNKTVLVVILQNDTKKKNIEHFYNNNININNNNNDTLFYTLAVTRIYIWFFPKNNGKYFAVLCLMELDRRL